MHFYSVSFFWWIYLMWKKTIINKNMIDTMLKFIVLII